MLVKDIKSQRGVGLVEVMVALLLLAGAVLGFSAMQLSAIKATDESLMRTRAISSIKALSESMRVLPDSSAVYRQQVNTIYTNNKKANSGYVISDYCTDVDTYKAAAPNCTTTNCSTAQVVKHNVATILESSCKKEIALNIEVCPGTSGINERQCVIAGWNQTKPTMNDEKFSCTNASGAYKPGSACFIMEAY